MITTCVTSGCSSLKIIRKAEHVVKSGLDQKLLEILNYEWPVCEQKTCKVFASHFFLVAWFFILSHPLSFGLP